MDSLWNFSPGTRKKLRDRFPDPQSILLTGSIDVYQNRLSIIKGACHLEILKPVIDGRNLLQLDY